ncbi:MAG: hypothetical protein SFX74_05165 [Fimbriimonadaceae bacterium]|nr:hypothetical protein [Fimbriimonadaceae bacterium]
MARNLLNSFLFTRRLAIRPSAAALAVLGSAVAVGTLALGSVGCGGSRGGLTVVSSVVGRTTWTAIDTSRTETFGPTAGGPRKLGLEVWYPASPRATGTPGPLLPAAVAETLEAATGIPASLLMALPTQSLLEAVMPDGRQKFPVVVFSHGNTTFPLESTSTAEALAARGFVVVGISHTGNAQFTRLDDTVVPADPLAQIEGVTPLPVPGSPFSVYAEYRANVAKQSQIFSRDIRFVLDELERRNTSDPRLKQRLDLSRVGVFGYSYGASHAFDAGRADARIRAVAGVDGTLWSADYDKGIRKPYLVFVGTRPTAEEFAVLRAEYIAMGYTPAQADQAVAWSQTEPASHAASPGSILVRMPKAQHSNFTDFGIWKGLGFPADEVSPEVPAASLLATYRKYLVAFFEEHLAGRRQPILREPSRDPNAVVSIQD